MSDHHFRIEDLRKIGSMTSLCGVWWCSNTICMACTFPKVKKSSSVPIEEVFVYVRVHSHGIARHKYYGVVTKRMKFNCPVIEASKSIETNNNDLEVNAIAYTFSKIFQAELKQFLRRYSELLSFVCFPLRGKWGN